MHFSLITISATALFILARLAAASSDHTDMDPAAAPLSNPGQLRPAHSRFAHHHRYEGGENSVASYYHRHRFVDDHYPSKDKRGWTGAANIAAASRNAQEQALRAKLRQLETPPRPPTTWRAADNRAKAFFRRGPAKPQSTPSAKGVKTSNSNLAQLEQQNRAIGASVDMAWRQQQSLQKALLGIVSGRARTYLIQRGNKIQDLFNQLRGVYQQSLGI